MFLNVLGIFFTSALFCSAAPTSEKEHCGKPGQIEGATLQGVWNAETYSPGSVATFTCLHGYIRDGPIKMACIEGSWLDISRGQCKILGQCSKPQQSHENGELEGQWNDETFPPGKIATYVCRQGYSQTNPIKMACIEGEWIHVSKGQCIAETVCYQETVKYGNVRYTKESYRDGETVELTCIEGYRIEHNNPEEPRKCTSRGWSPPLKCIKTCQSPKLAHGEYKTRESTFEVGEYVLYECNEGYFSSNKAFEGRSQCGSDGWYPKPECKEITCPLLLARGEESFKFGKVIYFQCPSNSKLEGASSSQCFYYGWGPTFPICKGPEGQQSLLLVDIKTEPKESNCATASAPPNARIKNLKDEYFSEDVMEIECNPGYLLYGSERVLCKDGRWQSPPLCTEKIPCSSSPPLISNGEISKETLAARYHTGSTVKYICADGYHIIGSDEIKCIDGKWLLPPTCVENSCGKPQEIENGKPRDGRKEYKHAESAAYECFRGYKLSGSEAAVCLYGKWDGIPKCIYSSCGPPLKISNGAIRGQEKTTYLTGEKVIYDCIRGYTVGNNANFITCENAAWTEPPECRRIGQTCGAPPVVQHGDVTDLRTLSYSSGSIVKYKCANFYKLEGKETITCRDGEWEKEPICRVPCTVREIDMQQNNIRFKHRDDNKLYSVHFDNLTFVCIPGYKISDEKRLRIQCLDGVLKYPKCLKEGTCEKGP